MNTVLDGDADNNTRNTNIRSVTRKKLPQIFGSRHYQGWGYLWIYGLGLRGIAF